MTALERERPEYVDAGRRKAAERIAEIAEAGREIGAPVWIVAIPSPVQICGPSDLRYYPRHVDLTDTERFDLEQPQRVTREIAERLGLRLLDLRATLKQAESGCPYQPRNLHWTSQGHRTVADRVADEILGCVAAGEGESLELVMSCSESGG